MKGEKALRDMIAPLLKPLKHVSMLWIGSLLSAGFAFLAQVLLARHLGPSGYGAFSSALATITLLTPLAGFGVGAFWLRVFGLEGWHARRWLKRSFWFLVVSNLLTCLLVVLWAFLSGSDSTTRLFLLWLTPLVISQTLVEVVSSRFQLEERYQALTLWQALPSVGRFLVAALALALKADIQLIATGFSITAVLTICGGVFALRGMLTGRFNLVGHGSQEHEAEADMAPGFFAVPGGAWPFALAGIFYLIYYQVDIVLVGLMVGSKAAGIYNVAFTIMAAVYLLPSTIYQKYLIPKLHRWAEHDRSHFLEVYRFGNGLMLAAGAIMALVIVIAAPWGVPLLFGAQYAQASTVLLILALCPPVKFLATSVGGTLVTQDHMRRKVWYQAAVAVINVLLNLVLIPRYSYYGSAAATVISESALLAIYLLAVRSHVFGEDAWTNWTIRYRRGIA